MNNAIYIESLHRPFSQQLKTTKWVCEFIALSKIKISSSNLNISFYYYLITILQKEYKKSVPDEYNGLPSKIAVNNIYEYLQTKEKLQFLDEIPTIVKSRNTPLEKQIYSTYKAASYYVNLAKDKFHLIDDKNELTKSGKDLLKLKSNFFKLSISEKEIYFTKILEADFHLFLTHCLFIRFEKKYSIKKTVDEQLDFINTFLKIRHFNFTSSSLLNYNVVRGYWAFLLDVTDSNGNIRKKYLLIINENPRFKILFEELRILVLKFEKENFKSLNAYNKKKKDFVSIYRKYIKDNINDLGFINLHDIKKEMRISSEKFQEFLSLYYEDEKNKSSLFFSNIVNSIDGRERFLIRNRPVIKIKIK